jgi:hypothetical protein
MGNKYIYHIQILKPIWDKKYYILIRSLYIRISIIFKVQHDPSVSHVVVNILHTHGHSPIRLVYFRQQKMPPQPPLKLIK